MRITRIDEIAPGGRALELHPQLTVLRGVPPELQRRLEAVLRSTAGLVAPRFGGELEVNGVRLSLDPTTLERLELDVGRDPVVVLGDVDDASGPAPGPPPQAPTGDVPPAPEHPGAAERPPVTDDVSHLRGELRAVGAQRQALEERMRAARERLDPAAPTALEVARGRIDALDLRRTAARSEWEARSARIAERRRDLSARIEALRDDVEALERLDPDAIHGAAASLRDAVEAPPAVDATAEELASQLESTIARLLEGRQRRDDLDRRRAELSARLVDAQRRADDAESAVRAPGDVDTVRRLEEVRDEIFETADKGARLSSRGRRRLQELRAEQAVLLEQLGFDTYSAYVMGIPSVRAEVERTSRADTAHERAEDLRAELERIDEVAVESTRSVGNERVEAELQTLLVLAHRELGPDDLRAVPLDVGGPGVEQLVASTVEALRTPRPVPVAADRVTVCRDALCNAIDAAAAASGSGSAARSTAPEVPDPPPLPTPGVGVEELLALAHRWYDWTRTLRDAVAGLRDELTAAQVELDGIEDDPVGSWAEIEDEIDRELDRLTDTEDRVRRHEAATDDLAELREQELVLRAREVELLERIADAGTARAPGASAPPPAPPGPRPAPGSSRGSTSPEPTGATRVGRGDSDERALAWELAATLAGLHHVSFVGSVPAMLVVGPGGAPEQVRVVVERLSALVQLVVLTDDVQLVDWARSLGERARPIEFATRVH